MFTHRLSSWLIIPLSALFLLNACGGGNGGGIRAPASLRYSNNPAVYTLGTPIDANTPNSSGGAVDSYTVDPVLPAGLALDGSTGVISGTPTGVSAAADYTLTATNRGGSASTTINITINVGSITAIGSLVEERDGATATLLPDGLVLIAGGLNDANSALAGAELYDPSTNSSTSTGAMSDARYAATATLLPNGLVLIAGGLSAPDHSLASAELYDPATGSFTATGSMAVARKDATATLLPNNKVLIAGGWNLASGSLTSAELYDPATGSFSATGPLVVARYAATATLLSNGKVLIAGGAHSVYALADAELYDPTADGFKRTSVPMIEGRIKPTATVLPNKQVLFAGGKTSMTSPVISLASMEIYDPVFDTFSRIGNSLLVARSGTTATLLPRPINQLLIAGGSNSFDGPLDSVEIYDSTTLGFINILVMAEPRIHHTATMLPDYSVLIAGGYNDINGALSSIDRLPY